MVRIQIILLAGLLFSGCGQPQTKLQKPFSVPKGEGNADFPYDPTPRPSPDVSEYVTVVLRGGKVIRVTADQALERALKEEKVRLDSPYAQAIGKPKSIYGP